MAQQPRDSVQGLESIIKRVPDIIYRLDTEGNITFVSDAVRKYGYSTDELAGTSMLELVHPEDRKKAAYRINERRTGERSTKSLEVRLLNKGSRILPSEAVSRGVEKDPIFFISAEGLYDSERPETAGFVGTQGIARDITEQERKEVRIEQQAEFLHLVLESLPHPFCVIDASDYTVRVANSAAHYARLSKEPTCYALAGKSNGPCGAQQPHPLEKIKETKQPVTVEHTYFDKDGKPRYFEVHAYPIFDNQGNVSQIIEYCVDITRHKRVEEALRESEERYRRITETITDYTYNVNVKDGRPEHTTHAPACVAVTGYKRNDFKVNPYLWIEMVHEEDRKAVLEQVEGILSGEKVEALEHRIVRKDGACCWVRNTPVPHFDSSGKLLGYDGLIQDVTDRKRLEDQLEQAQKMEAIGTLAGGIAHDFNNLLMAIEGNTSLMLLDIDSNGPQYERLKNIEQSVQSGAELTRQLLGFARGGKYEVKPTDLNELIKKQNRIFGRAKKEIIVRGKYEENLWTVDVDQGQIEQVLLNLYVNAADAMPGGGGLSIQTENAMLSEDYVKPYGVESGKYVKVSVADTGIGMDEETQLRIFEPFYTTKEMGRGTGLGLASAYGIVKNHGGFISVSSKKGEGTSFTIYLPASEKKAVTEEKSPGEVLKGEEMILLVDDEDMIIDVATEILKALGYNVLAARSGKEAIKIYKQNQERIALVILDMIMPDTGGGETYDRLKEVSTAVKVLLSSGYSIDGQATEIMEGGCDGFIQKPFDIKELSRKIREILDRNP